MRRRLRRTGRQRLARVLAPFVAIAELASGPLPAIAASPAASEATETGTGGGFTLTDQDGRSVTDAAYRGKWLLVYFGYTHCPDACPTALNNMAAALEQLDAPVRAKWQAIFVTVDPERDTPAVMKDYVGAFEGADIAGLTGTPQQVAAIEAAYRIHTQRHDQGDGEYSIDHPAFINIVDPDGHFAGLVSDLMQPGRLAKRLTQLVQ